MAFTPHFSEAARSRRATHCSAHFRRAPAEIETISSPRLNVYTAMRVAAIVQDAHGRS
jgi:hypothetical protein